MSYVNKEEMERLVRCFIADREERFPKITDDQVERWAGRMRKHFDDVINPRNDADAYWDFMPGDIEEI